MIVTYEVIDLKSWEIGQYRFQRTQGKMLTLCPYKVMAMYSVLYLPLLKSTSNDL